MNNKTVKANKREAGFTFAEMLVALLILLMVSSIVAVGIPVASNAYRKVVDSGNAQVLLSTTISALRNELQFAGEAKASDDKKSVAYVTADAGIESKIGHPEGEEAPGLWLRQYKNNGGGYGAKRLLVSDKAAGDNLYLTFDTVEYSDGVFTFTGLNVYKVGTTEPSLASASSVTIRVLSSD